MVQLMSFTTTPHQSLKENFHGYIEGWKGCFCFRLELLTIDEVKWTILQGKKVRQDLDRGLVLSGDSLAIQVTIITTTIIINIKSIITVTITVFLMILIWSPAMFMIWSSLFSEGCEKGGLWVVLLFSKQHSRWERAHHHCIHHYHHCHRYYHNQDYH